MRQSKPLRPVDLGRMVAISATQVRTYERVGFLPQAERSPAGYRRYTERHAEALRVSRTLIAGYGWRPALQVMRAVHAGDYAAALAIVDARHAALDRKRDQLDQTLRALENAGLSRTAEQPAKVHRRRPLTIGAAADLVGVRASALRHWERQGLLHPARDATTRNRRYDHQQLHRLQVIALLRTAGYRAHHIQAVLDDLSTGQPEQARQALQQRRQSLDRASWRRMEATGELLAYLRTNGTPPAEAPQYETFYP